VAGLAQSSCNVVPALGLQRRRDGSGVGALGKLVAEFDLKESGDFLVSRVIPAAIEDPSPDRVPLRDCNVPVDVETGAICPALVMLDDDGRLCVEPEFLGKPDDRPLCGLTVACLAGIDGPVPDPVLLAREPGIVECGPDIHLAAIDETDPLVLSAVQHVPDPAVRAAGSGYAC